MYWIKRNLYKAVLLASIAFISLNSSLLLADHGGGVTAAAVMAAVAMVGMETGDIMMETGTVDMATGTGAITITSHLVMAIIMALDITTAILMATTMTPTTMVTITTVDTTMTVEQQSRSICS